MFKGINLNQLKEKYDVVVIGAGIGGVVCANYLSKAGLSVLVVERHLRPGGYCTSFKRNGYVFSVSPNFLPSCGQRGLIEYHLSKLGIKVRFEKIKSFVIFTPEKKIKASYEWDVFKDELKINFPEESKSIEKFSSDLSGKYKFVLSPREKDKPVIEDLSNISYSELLNSRFKNPALKLVLSFPTGHMGAPANEGSALAGIYVIKSFFGDGPYKVVGGGQVLADELCNSLNEKGGDVLLSNEVKKIKVKDNQVNSVIVENGTKISCHSVVSNADALLTLLSLVGRENLPAEYAGTLQKMKPSKAVFQLYLGVKWPGMAECEGDYFPENNIESNFILSANSNRESEEDVSDKFSIIASAFSPIQFDETEDWKSSKAEIEQNLLNSVEKCVPGIKSRLEVMDSATPRTFYRYTLNHKGSGFGWANVPGQVWKDRLPNRTPVKGLYLAGHWTQPGSGVQAVFGSGAMVSGMILNEQAF